MKNMDNSLHNLEKQKEKEPHKHSEKSNSPARFVDLTGRGSRPPGHTAAEQIDNSFMKKVFSPLDTISPSSDSQSTITSYSPTETNTSPAHPDETLIESAEKSLKILQNFLCTSYNKEVRMSITDLLQKLEFCQHVNDSNRDDYIQEFTTSLSHTERLINEIKAHGYDPDTKSDSNLHKEEAPEQASLKRKLSRSATEQDKNIKVLKTNDIEDMIGKFSKFGIISNFAQNIEANATQLQTDYMEVDNWHNQEPSKLKSSPKKPKQRVEKDKSVSIADVGTTRSQTISKSVSGPDQIHEEQSFMQSLDLSSLTSSEHGSSYPPVGQSHDNMTSMRELHHGVNQTHSPDTSNFMDIDRNTLSQREPPTLEQQLIDLGLEDKISIVIEKLRDLEKAVKQIPKDTIDKYPKELEDSMFRTIRSRVKAGKPAYENVKTFTYFYNTSLPAKSVLQQQNKVLESYWNGSDTDIRKVIYALYDRSAYGSYTRKFNLLLGISFDIGLGDESGTLARKIEADFDRVGVEIYPEEYRKKIGEQIFERVRAAVSYSEDDLGAAKTLTNLSCTPKPEYQDNAITLSNQQEESLKTAGKMEINFLTNRPSLPLPRVSETKNNSISPQEATTDYHPSPTLAPLKTIDEFKAMASDPLDFALSDEFKAMTSDLLDFAFSDEFKAMTSDQVSERFGNAIREEIPRSLLEDAYNALEQTGNNLQGETVIRKQKQKEACGSLINYYDKIILDTKRAITFIYELNLYSLKKDIQSVRNLREAVNLQYGKYFGEDLGQLHKKDLEDLAKTYYEAIDQEYSHHPNENLYNLENSNEDQKQLELLKEELEKIDINLLKDAKKAIDESPIFEKMQEDICTLTKYHEGSDKDIMKCIIVLERWYNGNRYLDPDKVCELKNELTGIIENLNIEHRLKPWTWKYNVKLNQADSRQNAHFNDTIEGFFLAQNLAIDDPEAIKRQRESKEGDGTIPQLSPEELSQMRETVEKNIKHLATTLQKHPSFENLPITPETIPAVLCGLNKKLSKLTEKQLSYYGAVFIGIIEVINRQGEQFTGEYLGEIQKKFVPKTAKGSGYRNEPTSIAFGSKNRTGYLEHEKQCQEWNSNKDHPLNGMFMTEEEILEGSAVNAKDYNNTAYAVIVNKERKERLFKAAATYIHKACNDAIKDAKTDNAHEKLYYIARTVNWLAKGQLFNDANSRLTAYGILQKLLLDHGLDLVSIKQEETQIFKMGSTSIIRGAIQYYQQRLKAYENNPQEFLQAVEKGTLDDFEAEFFHKERAHRKREFDKLYEADKSIPNIAYNSFTIHQAMENAKRKIDAITQEQANNDPKGYYQIAKVIGEHIENFFIDRNYSSKESSMYSLYKLNEGLSPRYSQFQSKSQPGNVFTALCTLIEKLQKPPKRADNGSDDIYLTVSGKYRKGRGIGSYGSSRETRSSAGRTTTEEESSESESNSSQMIDLGLL